MDPDTNTSPKITTSKTVKKICKQSSNISMSNTDNLCPNEQFTWAYHLADIHIRNLQRHDEYQQVFRNLYAQLRKSEPGFIVLAGDILHSKTELSPESIDFVSNFLRTLAGIMPVVVIPGNHDGVVNNANRMDALTPIITNIGDPNIYYFKKGGFYNFGNVVFGVSSVFEGNTIQDPDKIKGRKSIKIYLYHGGVDASLISENSRTISQTVIDDFKGWDIVMLGDIHRQQFLKPNIAYSGSLIQQTRSEDLLRHGYIKWDLATKQGKFFRVRNMYGFVDVHINGGHIMTPPTKPSKPAGTGTDMPAQVPPQVAVDIDVETPEWIPKKPRIRYLVKNTNQLVLNGIIEKMRKKYMVQDTIIEYDDDDISPGVMTLASREVVRLDRDMDNSMDMFTQTFIDLMNEEGIQDETRKRLTDMFSADYRRISSYHDQTTRCNWELLQLKFSNMFSYGENNRIDFSGFTHQVVGIVGENHIGKSAIIDILCYAIWGYNSRVGTTGRHNLINNKKDHCRVELTFRIANSFYTIIRTLRMNAKTATGDVEFTCTTNGTTENLSGKVQKDTDKRIVELLGTFEDYVSTFINIQNDTVGFIEKTQCKRKDFLIKMFKLHLFEEALENIKKVKKETDAQIKVLKTQMGSSELGSLRKDVDEGTQRITAYQERLTNIKREIRDYNTYIQNFSKELTVANTVEYTPEKEQNLLERQKKLTAEMACLRSQIDDLTRKLDENKLIKIPEKKVELAAKKGRIFETQRKKFIAEKEAEIERLCTEKADISDAADIAPLADLARDHTKYESEIANGEAKCAEYTAVIAEYESQLKTLTKSPVQDTAKSGIDRSDLTLANYKKWQADLVAVGKLTAELQTLQVQLDNVTENLAGLGTPDFNLKCGVCKQKNGEWLTRQKDLLAKQTKFTKQHTTKTEQLAELHTVDELQTYIDAYMEHKERLAEKKETQMKLDHVRTALETASKAVEEGKKALKTIVRDIGRRKRIDRVITENAGIDQRIRDIRESIEEKRENKCPEVVAMEERQRAFQELKAERAEWRIKKTGLVSERKEKQHELDAIRVELENMIKTRESFTKNQALEESIAESTRERDRLDNEKGHVIQTIADVKHDIAKKKEGIEKLMTVGAELDALEADLKIYKQYEKMMNRDGMPKVFLNRIIPRIERNVNNIISQVADFTLDIVLSDKDELLLYIKYGTRKHLVDLGSGFEKFLTNLAFRIVLSEYASVSRPNFLIIDEGFSSFDNNHMNNLTRVFDYLKNRFDFVIIITHLDSLKSNIDREISIQKSDGFSVIPTMTNT